MPVAFLERASYNDAIDVEGKWKAPRGALEEIGHPPPGGACIQHPSLPLPGPRTVSNEHEKHMGGGGGHSDDTADSCDEEARERTCGISQCRTLALHCLVPFFFSPVNSSPRRSTVHSARHGSGSCFSPISYLALSFERGR
jgi:hypothetical protein